MENEKINEKIKPNLKVLNYLKTQIDLLSMNLSYLSDEYFRLYLKDLLDRVFEV